VRSSEWEPFLLGADCHVAFDVDDGIDMGPRVGDSGRARRPWIRLSRAEADAERVGDDHIQFPERLAARVIEAFSSVGELVLDPFAGFGTTPVVATRLGRRAIAVELLPERADLIRRRVGTAAVVITGDARELAAYVDGPIDLCFTSPPYMTWTGHPENPLTGYRTMDAVYDRYLDDLESVGRSVARLLRPGGHLVINVATIVGRDGLTRLARDLADRLTGHLPRLEDLTIEWDVAPEGIADDRCLVFRRGPT
jgi:DNA modification methylase